MVTSSQIISNINQYINTNGVGAITGEILNGILRDMVFNISFDGGALVTSDLDTLFTSGIFRYSVGTLVLVNNYSSTNIRQVRVACRTAGGLNLEFRTYNGTTWSSWINYLQGDIDKLTQRVAVIYKISDTVNTTGIPLNGYQYQPSTGKVFVNHSGMIEIDYQNELIYIWDHNVFYYDTTNHKLVVYPAGSSYGVREFLTEVNLDDCEVFPNSVDANNYWVGAPASMSIIPMQSSHIKVTAGSNGGVILVLTSVPVISGSRIDASYYAMGYSRRITYAANEVVDLKLPYNCKYILVSRTNSSGGSNAPAKVEKDIDPLLAYSNPKISEIFNQGLMNKDSGVINVMNPNGYPINDVKYHAANEADIWINSKTGFMYAVFPENDTSYYETKGRIGLSVFSLATPWNVEHYEVFKNGDSGLLGSPAIAYLCPIESENKLRIFLNAFDTQTLQYKDFDMVNKTFGSIQHVKYNGSDLTATVINNLIVAAGGTSQSTQFIKPETLYNNPRDGYTYQMFAITDIQNQQRVILRSNDNFATVEYVGVFPYKTRFDAIMNYYNGTFYFLYRKESSTGLQTGDGVYLTTTQDFSTYTTPVQVSTMDMRPDLFIRDSQVYLVVGEKRNQGDGFYRTNSFILKGRGSTLAGYTKIVNITDDRGIVNPRARLFGDDIHYLYSDSPIRLDKENGYYTPVSSSPQYQGKECECYLRIRMK